MQINSSAEGLLSFIQNQLIPVREGDTDANLNFMELGEQQMMEQLAAVEAENKRSIERHLRVKEQASKLRA